MISPPSVKKGSRYVTTVFVSRKFKDEILPLVLLEVERFKTDQENGNRKNFDEELNILFPDN
jgi:hypothetical protein